MRVCRTDDLVPERGAAALVGGRQVALFRIVDDDIERVLAIDHRDPVTGSNVLARGLVGRTGDRWYVASPLHKQRFDLETGACIDDDEVSVATFTVQVRGGVVDVSP